MADPNTSTPNPPPSGIERRQHARFMPSAGLCGHLIPNARAVIVADAVLDVSAGGVQLLVHQPLPVNALATVDLFNVARNVPCRQSVRIVHVEQRPDGYYAMGAAFDRVLGTVEVQNLV